MKNIIDYTSKKLPSFDVLPFNDIDSLILSTLSYIDFSYLMNKTKQRKFVIKDIPLIPIKEGVKNLNWSSSYYTLFKNIKSNARYNNLIIDNIDEVNNTKYETHFKAISFQSENFAYVAFMGTGIQMHDWKEDFNMAYKKPVPAHKLSKYYINKVIPKLDGDIYVGGHSKGGNLAIYASIYTKLLNKFRIKKVYNFDGPGFSIDVYKSIKYKMIKKKISKIVPSSSIVGMLLLNEENYKIIKSNGVSIQQHNPFNWLIKKNDFIYLKERSIDSRYIDKTITNWISELNDKEVALFVNTLFELLGQEEGNKIKPNNIFKIIKSIYKVNKKMNKDTKNKMNEIYNKLKYHQKENIKNFKEL